MSTEIDRLRAGKPNQKAENPVQQVPSRSGADVRATKALEGRMHPAIEGTLAFANTAFDAGTFGTSRYLMGMGNIAQALIREPYLMDNAGIAKLYREGFEGTDQFFDEEAAKLPMGVRLGSEIVGAGKGLPNLIDNFINDAQVMAPTAGQRLAKRGLTFGAAGGSGALDEYMRGDQDFGDALMAGAFSGLVGGGAQIALGDNVFPSLARRRISTDGVIDPDKVGVQGYPASVLATNTRGQEGLTLNNLYEMTEKGFDDPNIGLLDLSYGTTSQADVAQRVYNGLAELAFPRGIDPTKINLDPSLKANIQLYDETVGAIRQAAEEANASYKLNVDTLLGNHADNFEQIKARGPNAKAAGEVLGSIKRTLPNPDGSPSLGSTIMPGDEVRDFLKSSETEFAKEMGQTEIGFAGEPAKQVWRMYTDQFRLSEQEAIGLDWNMKEIDKSTKSTAEVYTDLPLARLYNGRAAIAELVGPNAPSPEHNRAALALMRVLDGKIDELTAGKAGLARGEYAQAKGIEDAYDLGTKYFMGRNADFSNLDKYHQTFGTSLDDYMDKLPPLARESFSEGWKRGLYEKFERDGFAETMNYLIGPPNATGDRVRKEGIAHMRKVLGNETADKLIAMHNDGRRLVDMREKLEQLYLFKEASPGKRAELIDGAIEMSVEAEQGGALTGLIADLQKIKRAVKPDDQAKVLEMERLLRLRGPELAAALNASAKSLIPLPTQLGNRAGATAADLEAYFTGEGMFSPEFDRETERAGIPQGPSITDRLRGSE